ncbi:unnamed protein product [Notodromas monacha]|uniref:Reverse transcriptase/retrotransposon-derived protein RNase H-like domain-containing protein n=1 Tax=Notodromas monacha TaxID=399045 RepID=A0A7R9BKT0_9CRUS|nr:unnamed protein product [Notodromas monacha]CAG0917053.1 unnamed protein product [Notodromas monacha]
MRTYRSHGDPLPEPGKRQDRAVTAVLCYIPQDTDNSLTIIIGIKDKRVTALIDTGATRSFMATNVAAKVGLTPHPTKAKISTAVLHISTNISHSTGTQPADKHLKAVQAFPKPKTTKQMRRFLGLATYLRSHVRTNFANLEKTLCNTIPLKPATALKWTPEAEATFEALKQANRHRQPKFKLGQMVTLRPQLKTTEKHAANRRFLPKRFGPFRITAILGKAKYCIQTLAGNRQANAWELQAYNFPVAPPPTIPKYLMKQHSTKSLCSLDTEETNRPRFCLDPGTLDATNESNNKAHPTTSSPKVHQACSETPNQAPAMPDRSLPCTPTATSPVSSVDIPPFNSPPQEPTLPPQPDLTTAANAADSPAPVAPNCQWRKRQRTSSPAAGHWHNRSTAQDPSRTTNTSNNNLTSTESQDAQGS